MLFFLVTLCSNECRILLLLCPLFLSIAAPFFLTRTAIYPKLGKLIEAIYSKTLRLSELQLSHYARVVRTSVGQRRTGKGSIEI